MLLSIGALLVLVAVASAVPLPQKRQGYEDDHDLEGLQLLTDDKRRLSSAAAARKSVRSSGSAKAAKHNSKRFDDDDDEGYELDQLGEVGQQDDFQLWIPDSRAIQLGGKKRSVAAAAKHGQTKKYYGDGGSDDDDSLVSQLEPDTESEDTDQIEDRDYGYLFGGHGKALKKKSVAKAVQRPGRFMTAIGLGSYGGGTSGGSSHYSNSNYDDDRVQLRRNELGYRG